MDLSRSLWSVPIMSSSYRSSQRGWRPPFTADSSEGCSLSCASTASHSSQGIPRQRRFPGTGDVGRIHSPKEQTTFISHLFFLEVSQPRLQHGFLPPRRGPGLLWPFILSLVYSFMFMQHLLGTCRPAECERPHQLSAVLGVCSGCGVGVRGGWTCHGDLGRTTLP